MPDISIAYKLHLECGKMINLYDWLQAFLSIVDPNDVDDESKRIVRPELQYPSPLILLICLIFVYCSLNLLGPGLRKRCRNWSSLGSSRAPKGKRITSHVPHGVGDTLRIIIYCRFYLIKCFLLKIFY